MGKFGRTLMFILFILLIVQGGRMLIKVADPYTRKLSPSLADALKEG